MPNTIKGIFAPNATSSLIDDIENRAAFSDYQMEAVMAILDAACVLCELERTPAHHDSGPSHHGINTGCGFAHGRRVFDSTLPTLLSHAHCLMSNCVDDVENVVTDAVGVLKRVMADEKQMREVIK